MTTTFGFAKFTATGQISFYLEADVKAKEAAFLALLEDKPDAEPEENDSRQKISAEIQNTEDLQPLCDAINAASAKTNITAELRDVIGSAGNTIKTCILKSEQAESINLEFIRTTPENIDFILFQPGLLKANSIGLDNRNLTVSTISNSVDGLVFDIKALRINLHPTPITVFFAPKANQSTAAQVALLSDDENSDLEIESPRSPRTP